MTSGFCNARADEVHVSDVDRVHLAGGEAVHEMVRQRLRSPRTWAGRGQLEPLDDRPLLEVEVADALLARGVQVNRLPGRLLLPMKCVGGPQHAAVVSAGQAAVAGDDQQGNRWSWSSAVGRRSSGCSTFPIVAASSATSSRTLLRVRLGADGPLQRLLELRRRDHLHGLGDLADVAHRLAAFDDCASFCHRSARFR